MHLAIANARAGARTVSPRVDAAAVRAALAEVPDPEIPVVSIIDLGMVEDVEVGPDGIRVALLPTFVGCPALDLIRASVERRLRAFDRPVDVRFDFRVPWTSDRITSQGRDKLRASGFRASHAGRDRCPGPGPAGHPGSLPELRLAPYGPRKCVRADAVPGHLPLRRLSPAVRDLQDHLIVGTDRRDVGIVGVVGAGTMGAGIAQLALEAGHEVVLHDIDDGAIERGRARVRDGLARRAAGLELDDVSVDDWITGRLARLRDAQTLDALGAEAEIVIEAALEDLELKRAIFRALDAAAAPDVILATNTSALSVAAIAAATAHPERVIGLHFFNPAPVMPLVEVIVPPEASETLAQHAAAVVEGWGKTVVRSADTPGFIVNRVNRPFTLEALAMLEAGEASIEAIDRALHEAGFPMGPFELMDLVGIDVNLAAAKGIWEDYQLQQLDRNYKDPRNAERILKQVAAFDPAYVLTESPDAVNGPPIIDDSGNVLGGNSRMTIARVYRDRLDAAQSLRIVAEGPATVPPRKTSRRLPHSRTRCYCDS